METVNTALGSRISRTGSSATRPGNQPDAGEVEEISKLGATADGQGLRTAHWAAPLARGIAPSSTRPARATEHRVLVECLVQMAKVLLEQRRNSFEEPAETHNTKKHATVARDKPSVPVWPHNELSSQEE